jgi:NADH:ubiquinone oxidoreductase subunit E
MEITICIGSSCHLKGSRDVIKILERLISFNRLEEQIALKGSFCMGECSKDGVCICVNNERFNITPSEADSFFNNEIVKRLQDKYVK